MLQGLQSLKAVGDNVYVISKTFEHPLRHHPIYFVILGEKYG